MFLLDFLSIKHIQTKKAQKSAVFLPVKSIKYQKAPHKPTLSSTSSMPMGGVVAGGR